MSKTKPCQICGDVGHYPYQCFKNPKRQKIIKRRGKIANKWSQVRTQWFVDYPAEIYICYICGNTLLPAETTLDHVIPRSARPDLRFEYSNLMPCCLICNNQKGSKH